MNDADPRLSKIVLAHAVVGTGLNLAASVGSRGARRTAVFFALATGLPAAGELFVTGPLGLLRHRASPRPAGVPLAVLLGWYCVVHGVFVVAERLLEQLPVDEAARRGALPPVAAAVGLGLDLIMDPAGLDAGLWEWNVDGAYATDVEGANGRRGVPLVNFLGWLALVAGVAAAYGRVSGKSSGGRPGGRLPAALLAPYYLAAVAWAVRRRRWRYLVYSLPFPVALGAALRKR